MDMEKKEERERKLLQVRLEKDVIRELKVKAALRGSSVTRLITEWVRSWESGEGRNAQEAEVPGRRV